MTSPVRWPDFFIVGAPKCGTTAMHSYLRQHPDVFMPLSKEPLYFGDDLSRRYGRLRRDEYLALFAPATAEQRLGEASTWYLYSRSAAREIKAVAPAAAIVVMLRSPIEVMRAQHSQLLFNRQENITDFAEALAAEPERRRGERLPPGPIRRETLYYRDTVRFAGQLQRYLEVFGAERVHVILHDDLQRDLAGEYRRLLAFLGVDPDFEPDFSRKNENKLVRNQLVQRLLYAPPILVRFAPALRRHALVRRLRDGLATLNSRPAARPALDPTVAQQLAQELAPEIAQLGELLGRDLSAWVSHAPQATRDDAPHPGAAGP